MERTQRFWNPYLAGIALGLVLLTTLVMMGHGLGASGAANRFGTGILSVFAPIHTAQNGPMRELSTDRASILDDWLVFEVFGVFLGGLVAAYSSGRLKGRITRGPRIAIGWRLGLALFGGILMGVAARLARGCTSGQALTGGALLSVGSWVFMLAVFAGGYGVAYFVRRQWT